MINSDRRARMLLSCAMDCGDPRVAELVQNISAEGAWAKIIEGVLGEPAAQRAARVSVDAVERQAKAAAMRYVVPGDQDAQTMGRPHPTLRPAPVRMPRPPQQTHRPMPRHDHQRHSLRPRTQRQPNQVGWA
jgi:hypothetical protein